LLCVFNRVSIVPPLCLSNIPPKSQLDLNKFLKTQGGIQESLSSQLRCQSLAKPIHYHKN
jgi:hypothetical protein